MIPMQLPANGTVRGWRSRYVARSAAWTGVHFGSAYASSIGTPMGAGPLLSRSHTSLTATRMSPAPSKRLSAT